MHKPSVEYKFMDSTIYLINRHLMKNIKPQVIISAISIFILAAIGGILFIINSNDHKECATSVYYYTNSKGEKVKEEKHICKERFNL
jgi:hypothetical protein